MPINKDAYSRYRIIDNTLRKNKSVKSKRLAEICSDKLGIKISMRTIQKDIKDLIEDTSLGIFAPIKKDNSAKTFYYPENVNQIFPSLELQDEELNALLFYANTLRQYKEFGVFKNFTNAIDKIVDAVNIQSSQQQVCSNIIIQPENIPKFRGSELIPEIISAFDKKKKVKFSYKKHDSGVVKNHTVSTILLKEFDHLWYLLGQIEGKDFITTFALDRISDFSICESCSEEVVNFDPDNYYNHVFGIAVPEQDIEEVILEFDSWRGQYLKSAPIHKSQEIVSETEAHIRVKLRVIPFHELHGKILSYGKHVKVIAPDSLIDEITTHLNEALNKY
jgi:predicted DNA-binding transcriptional regulator YafY